MLSYPQAQRSLVFTPTLLPSNRVYVQVPGTSDLASNFTTHVVGLPKHFLMGLTAVEYVAQSPSVTDKELVRECLTALSHTLQHTSLPALLKEMIFHLVSTLSRKVDTHAVVPSDLHKALVEEFCTLYSKELVVFGHEGEISFPSSCSVALGGRGRFSTYLQSLFEMLYSLGSLHPLPTPDVSPHPTPAGRMSAYEKPSRKISRPLPVKSLSCDPDVVSIPQPSSDLRWINNIHESLSVMEGIVSTGEISLFELEGGLMISPQSRLLVIAGLSPTPEALDTLRGLASVNGGLYEDGLYQCEGGVVLEVVHRSKIPSLSVAVWSCEELKTSGDTELKVFTVGDDLKCDNEEGALILERYLHHRLSDHLISGLHKDAQARRFRVLGEIFSEEELKKVAGLSEEAFVERIRGCDIKAVWRSLFSHGVDLHGDKYASVRIH